MLQGKIAECAELAACKVGYDGHAEDLSTDISHDGLEHTKNGAQNVARTVLAQTLDKRH